MYLEKLFSVKLLYSIPFFTWHCFHSGKQLPLFSEKHYCFSFFWDSCSSHPAMYILLHTENLPG